MLITPADLSILAAETLFEELSVLLTGAKGWPPGFAAPLARPDWSNPAAGTPAQLVQLARLIDELVTRGGAGKLSHELRERFLPIYEQLQIELPEAARFFDRHRADIRKMRARSSMLRRVSEMRADRRAKALIKIGIDVHPDDVAELRAFAAGLLKKRNIKPVVGSGQRRPGRPRKSSLLTQETQTSPVVEQSTPPQAAPAPSPAPAVKRRPTKEDFDKFF
jgi:hypothetical protein